MHSSRNPKFKGASKMATANSRKLFKVDVEINSGELMFSVLKLVFNSSGGLNGLTIQQVNPSGKKKTRIILNKK